MSERIDQLMQVAGLKENVLNSLERGDSVFVLTDQTLLFQDSGGTRRVTLRDLKRIHSDQDGLLRVETPAGTALTANLLGFDPAAVQSFFAQVRDATARAKQQTPLMTSSGTVAPTPVAPSPAQSSGLAQSNISRTAPVASPGGTTAIPTPSAPVAGSLDSRVPERPVTASRSGAENAGMRSEPTTATRPPVSERPTSGFTPGVPSTPPARAVVAEQTPAGSGLAIPAPSTPSVSPSGMTPPSGLQTGSVQTGSGQTGSSLPGGGLGLSVSGSSGFASPALPGREEGSVSVKPMVKAVRTPTVVTDPVVLAQAEVPSVTRPVAETQPTVQAPEPPTDVRAADALAPAPRVAVPTVKGSAAGSLASLAAVAGSVSSWVGALKAMSLVMLLATFGMAYLQYSRGEGISGFWALIAGGMGAVALWALSDVVKLLVSLAQAVSAEGGVMDVD